MLDYVKTILSKVSFDPSLFEKELRKAIGSLLNNEIHELKAWCYRNYSKTHQPILNRCFAV